MSEHVLQINKERNCRSINLLSNSLQTSEKMLLLSTNMHLIVLHLPTYGIKLHLMGKHCFGQGFVIHCVNI